MGSLRRSLISARYVEQHASSEGSWPSAAVLSEKVPLTFLHDSLSIIQTEAYAYTATTLAYSDRITQMKTRPENSEACMIVDVASSGSLAHIAIGSHEKLCLWLSSSRPEVEPFSHYSGGTEEGQLLDCISVS
jgi:hypothetical protein